MSERPLLVPRAARRPASGLPIGSAGEEAFADPGGWVRYLSLEPGAASGWHHHGAWNSYACVHRDVSAGDETLEMILFRAGEGPLTVNVHGPNGGEAR